MQHVLENIELKIYEHGFAIYRESVKLRNQILLEPLDRSEPVSDYDFPEKDIYIGAFLGERLLGTLVLTPVDSSTAKMRQLAVHERFRKQGIGHALVEKFENIARHLGFTKIVLHARESAVLFYKHLDYIRIGKRFVEVDLPHWKMEKNLLLP